MSDREDLLKEIMELGQDVLWLEANCNSIDYDESVKRELKQKMKKFRAAVNQYLGIYGCDEIVPRPAKGMYPDGIIYFIVLDDNGMECDFGVTVGSFTDKRFNYIFFETELFEEYEKADKWW